MVNRRKFMVAGVVVAATALSGCGLGSSGSANSGAAQKSVAATGKLSGSITFQTWSLKNEKFTPYFTALIAAYEKAHPGTRINWIDQPGDGYADKVSSQITGGNLPDVVNLPPDIAHDAASSGALLNLAKNDPKLTGTYVKSGLAAYTFNGMTGTFGYPWYLGTDVNYWNTQILRKAGVSTTNLPATLDELIAAAKKVHDSSAGKAYLMSRKPGLDDFVRGGVPIESADGKKFVFNTPEAAAIVDKYVAAYKSGYMPPDVLSTDYQGNDQLFRKRVVGWTTSTGFYIKDLKQSNPTLAPLVVGSPALGTPPLYVQGISVAAKSKNPSLALSFAQFVTDNANQTAFVQIAQGFLPGTIAAQSDPAFTKSDGSALGNAAVIAAKEIPQAKVMTPPTWSQAMQTYFDQQVALAMQGKQSSKSALDKIVSKANSLLTS